MENKTNLEHYLEKRTYEISCVPNEVCKMAYKAKHNDKSCDGEECFDCVLCNNVKEIVKVLLSEYKEKPKLTEDEKAIFRNIPKKYKYIARDSCGKIYVYSTKPVKRGRVWDADATKCFSLDLFEHLFKFIKWEDEEPYEISKLLEEQGGN